MVCRCLEYIEDCMLKDMALLEARMSAKRGRSRVGKDEGPCGGVGYLLVGGNGVGLEYE